MSTKTHDGMIEDAAEWAISLGYYVVEKNLERRQELMQSLKTIGEKE